MNKQDIWITSDSHFGHKNIVKGISNWSDTSRCRDFGSQEHHDSTIVDNINKYVKEDDILYHLGDWSFGGIENIFKFRERIICKNIHLILGNHDHHIEKDRILPNVKVRGGDVYARDIFNSVNYVLTEKIFGHSVFMSHYAHRIWNKSHKGRIHLYGHSHGTIPDQGKSMDVGVDVAYKLFGEYRPFKWQEIQKIMANRDISYVDHHNKETN